MAGRVACVWLLLRFRGNCSWNAIAMLRRRPFRLGLPSPLVLMVTLKLSGLVWCEARQLILTLA